MTTPNTAPGGAAATALLRLLTVLTGLATATVVLGPRALVVDGRDVVTGWLDLHPSAAAAVIALGGVEAAGNVVLFVPFAALLAASVPRRALLPVLVAACLLPLLAETAQRWLPGRVPDGADIARNTVGLLVAFTAVAVLRLVLAVSRRLRRGRAAALRTVG